MRPTSAGRLPAPATLRFVSKLASATRPPAPFGARWSDDAGALAVALEIPEPWPASGLGDVGPIAAQVPEAASLPPGTLVVVLGTDAGAGLLGRLFLGRRAVVARAVRGSALLARGYTRIGGGVDATSRLDLVWGFA